MINTLQLLYRLVFSVYLISLPLLVYGVSVSGFSVRFSRIILLLVIPLVALKFWYRPALILRDKFFLLALVPYLIYTSISISWSPNVETGTGIQRLGGLYEVVLLYLACAAADMRSRDFPFYAAVMTVSSICPVFTALWQLANNFLHFSPHELPFPSLVIEGKYTEVVEGRYFVAASEFSRLSGTFAEPVIFASFLCTVLFLSLGLRPLGRCARMLLFAYRCLIVVIITFALSKLALLCLFLGFAYLARHNVRILLSLLFLPVALLVIVWLMSMLGFGEIFDRLRSESGHYELLVETLGLFDAFAIVVGNGIGSVPYGSFHRFVISRIYESGLVGLYFVVALSIFALAAAFRRARDENDRRVRDACGAAVLSILFGLHVYDYFIHLSTWAVLGVVASNSGAVSGFRRSEVEKTMLVR